MKKFVVSAVMFFVLAAFVVFHSVVLFRFEKKAADLFEKTEYAARCEDWQKAGEYLREFENEWNKKRLWASVTVKTDAIEDIEISLKQCAAMASLGAKPDFFSEFIMLEKLVRHIPHREGFHMEEIL